MRLRPAAEGDLALLRHWDEQPHVRAAGVDDWGWERELRRNPDWRELLIAEVDGRPIGFIQIIDPAREESHYWGACPDTCARSMSGSARSGSAQRFSYVPTS